MDPLQKIIRQQARLERYVRQNKREPEPGPWVPFPTTWTYASASSFTIADPGEGYGADDFTSHIQAGDFIRLKQGGAFLHFMITAVAYADPTTTVTVTKDITGGGSDLADAAITDNYYSKAWSPQGCGPGQAPKRATMWHGQAIVTTGNAIAASVLGTQILNGTWLQSAAAVNDAFTNGCYLRSGTYTFRALGFTNNNCGQVTWALDGVTMVANQDWYSAGVVVNVVKSVAAIAVVGDGWHVVTGTVAAKNGASSDYYLPLSCYWFEPASD